MSDKNPLCGPAITLPSHIQHNLGGHVDCLLLSKLQGRTHKPHTCIANLVDIEAFALPSAAGPTAAARLQQLSPELCQLGLQGDVLSIQRPLPVLAAMHSGCMYRLHARGRKLSTEIYLMRWSYLMGV